MARARRGGLVALFGMLAIASSGCEPRPGKLREQWERANETLCVRVEVFDEGNKAHIFAPAYVFLQWWYAVTVDGGANWVTWDVAAHLPGKVFYHPRLIQAVSIAADGTGAMTLNPEGTARNMPLTLVTNNFGVEWAIRQSSSVSDVLRCKACKTVFDRDTILGQFSS